MLVKTKNLLLIMIIFGLIVPQLAFAVFGLLDYTKAALSGIEEKTKSIFDTVVTIFFFYIIGAVLLHISTGLLDWVVTEQAQWLTLQGSELVRAGFAFTTGLANIFLILILIAIAFTYILKLETFQTKKSLPKLIMVALLINFSLVFIGMLIDIANIFYNTILGGNEDLVNKIIKTLGAGGWITIQEFLSWFTVFAFAALVPFIHALPLQVFVLVGAAGFLLPNIIIWTSQLILFYLMAGIFFIYVFLFAARVFIIQILAILSPLAFLSLILPQTEKYWKEWLQHLVQWVFFGIFFLFFLVLGLRASVLLIPPGGLHPWPIGGWFIEIHSYFIYYFFLFIYMVILLKISEKTMPSLASFMIQQATTWATRAWTGVGVPLASKTRKQLEMTATEEKRREEKIEAKRDRREKLTSKEKGALWLSRYGSRPIRWAYRSLTKTTPEAEVAKDLEKKIGEFEKKFERDVASATEVYGGTKHPLTLSALALYLQKIRGTDGLGKLKKEQLYRAIEATARFMPHRLGEIVKHKPELIDETKAQERGEEEAKKRGITRKEDIEKIVKENERIAELIQKTMVSKGAIQDSTGRFLDKDIQFMAGAGIKIDDQDIKELVTTPKGRAKVIAKAAYKKAVDALKITDIDTLSMTTLENEEFKEALIRFKPWKFISDLGGEKGSGYMGKLQEKAKKIGLEEIAKTNDAFIKAPDTFAGSLLMDPWERDEAKDQEVPGQITFEEFK